MSAVAQTTGLSPAENLLGRLDAVTPNGPGLWMARCPAHDDRSPSLSIRGLDDGRLLIHCFAGCEANDILAAVGLTLSDLYPEPLRNPHHNGSSYPSARRPFSALDALRCIAQEALRCAIAATDVAAGRPVSVEDAKRVMTAAHRIADALATVGGA